MKNKKHKEIPKTLEECFLALDKIFSDKEKIAFGEMTEDEFFCETHFGVGMYIRNQWLRQENSPLLVYFSQKNLQHLDDMSSIILVSYYRILTQQPIDLQGQIQYYLEYWQKTQGGRSTTGIFFNG